MLCFGAKRVGGSRFLWPYLKVMLHQLRPSLTQPLPAPAPLDRGQVQGEGARHRPAGGGGLVRDLGGLNWGKHTRVQTFSQTCDGLL